MEAGRAEAGGVGGEYRKEHEWVARSLGEEEYYDDDGEYYNDEDWDDGDDIYDDSDEDEIQPRALPVAESLGDDDGPPASGEEYLRQVRMEASQCPKVVRARIDPKLLQRGAAQGGAKARSCIPSGGRGFAEAPIGVVARKSWADGFVHDFSSLRAALAFRLMSEQGSRGGGSGGRHQAPPRGGGGGGSEGGNGLPPYNPLRDREAWRQHMMAGAAAGGGRDWGEGGGAAGKLPLLSDVLAFDDLTVDQLVCWVAEWAEEAPEVTERMGQWVFALCARASKPLTADVAAALRSLLRRCCVLRAAYVGAKSGGGAGATNEGGAGGAGDVGGVCDPAVARLSVVIAITGVYFGQGGEAELFVGDESEE